MGKRDTVDTHSRYPRWEFVNSLSSLLKLSLVSLCLGLRSSFGRASPFSRGCCRWHFPWILLCCLAGLSVLLHCLEKHVYLSQEDLFCVLVNSTRPSKRHVCLLLFPFHLHRVLLPLPAEVSLMISTAPPLPSPPLSCDSRSLGCRLNRVNYRQNLEGLVSMGVGMRARLKTPCR